MAYMNTLIYGNSGCGKTYSLRNLDPKTTMIFSGTKKPLPWKGSMRDWTVFDPKTGNGNLVYSTDYTYIEKMINAINKGARIKTIVFDDITHVLITEYINRSMETGFQKFAELAKNYSELFFNLLNLKDEINVVVVTHGEHDADRYKVKTVGKVLDEKVCLESLFTVVLRAVNLGEKGYKFQTQTLNDVSKSPEGMFEEMYIDNDIVPALKKMQDYYGTI